MDSRSIRSAVALAATLIVVVVMAVYGLHQTMKPFPKLTRTTPQATCARYATVRVIKAKDVTVNVYNATNTSGLAKDVMHALQARGFSPGQMGNAPSSLGKTPVTIQSSTRNDPQAKLLAMQFRPAATVQYSGSPVGPGLSVIVGKGYKKVRAGAPLRLRLSSPARICIAMGTPGA